MLLGDTNQEFVQQPEDLQRIITVYFSDEQRMLRFSEGEQILTQGQRNDRLFWVKRGVLSGYRHNDNSKINTKVYEIKAGMFFGVHSFFAQSEIVSSSVIADEDCEVMWIDHNTPAVDVERYGSISEQFMPVMVHALAHRQLMTGLQAHEKEEALEKLHLAEQMTTLGQLAAGIAHELNNAVGVLSSKTDIVEQTIEDMLADKAPSYVEFLKSGSETGQTISSSEVRQRGKQLAQDYGLERNQAKLLARAVPSGAIPKAWLDDLPNALRYWDLGRDFHDMRLASQHAARIVRSVKQLGGADNERYPNIDVNQTIYESLSLLQSELRRVSVSTSPMPLPMITASSTELVQVWVNIIKNACDAMEDTHDAQIEIATRAIKSRILVTISNNGPMIDPLIRQKIFQPDFTTKKGGLSFGLGLGLSIVKRIVQSYGGAITLKTDPKKTVFRIKLPIA